MGSELEAAHGPGAERRITAPCLPSPAPRAPGARCANSPGTEGRRARGQSRQEEMTVTLMSVCVCVARLHSGSRWAPGRGELGAGQRTLLPGLSKKGGEEAGKERREKITASPVAPQLQCASAGSARSPGSAQLSAQIAAKIHGAPESPTLNPGRFQSPQHQPIKSQPQRNLKLTGPDPLRRSGHSNTAWETKGVELAWEGGSGGEFRRLKWPRECGVKISGMPSLKVFGCLWSRAATARPRAL